MPFCDSARWLTIKSKICDTLFENVNELQAAIASYCPSIKSMKCLAAFFIAYPEEKVNFFESLLPKMQKILKNSPKVLTEAPCLLKTGMNKSIWITQEQCATALVLLERQVEKVCFVPDGLIEDQGRNNVQVDFADEFIGGLTLRWDTLQEEIRFLISPELTVAQLFFEKMSDSEAIIITGAERFSRYSGYSKSFRFRENFVDTQIRDCYRRKKGAGDCTS
ncbi:unnamed protein product [Oikopleura dioica]|uniref:poly(ADP-ribose) glycohydrolase n=1 Tax=Oikopleura dioica TaxID=34765 RepID=E4YG77_OIKDI|nr:unnamed protein product [Oikopleura dioica]